MNMLERVQRFCILSTELRRFYLKVIVRNQFLLRKYFSGDFVVYFQAPVPLYVGLYYVYIQDWFAVYPREQFHFVRLRDYSKNTDFEMEKVFNFLHLGMSTNSTL